MLPLSKVEIKPTQSVGLRLPFAAGRVMLLDRPLNEVRYRGRMEPDVAGYVEWANKALKGTASHMSKKDVYDFIVERLRSFNKEDERIEPIIVPPQSKWETRPHEPAPPVAESSAKVPGKYGAGGNFKGMKGKSWHLITHAWSGNMEPDSLNHWIRQISLYSPFKFPAQADAVDVIEQFIDELPDWSFSDRLSSGNRRAVSAIVRRDVKIAFDGWPDQPNPKKSAAKLKAVWNRWQSTERDLFDKLTWGIASHSSCYQEVELKDDFSWADSEMQQLNSIARLLSSELATTAAAVRHLIRLIYVHQEVPRTWVRDLLNDYGIKANSKRLDKPKKLIDKLIELEWIYVPRTHFRRRCRRFGLAKLRAKFPQLGGHTEDAEDDVVIVYDNYLDLRNLNQEFLERQDEIFA